MVGAAIIIMGRPFKNVGCVRRPVSIGIVAHRGGEACGYSTPLHFGRNRQSSQTAFRIDDVHLVFGDGHEAEPSAVFRNVIASCIRKLPSAAIEFHPVDFPALAVFFAPTIMAVVQIGHARILVTASHAAAVFIGVPVVEIVHLVGVAQQGGRRQRGRKRQLPRRLQRRGKEAIVLAIVEVIVVVGAGGVESRAGGPQTFGAESGGVGQFPPPAGLVIMMRQIVVALLDDILSILGQGLPHKSAKHEAA